MVRFSIFIEVHVGLAWVHGTNTLGRKLIDTRIDDFAVHLPPYSPLPRLIITTQHFHLSKYASANPSPLLSHSCSASAPSEVMRLNAAAERSLPQLTRICILRPAAALCRCDRRCTERDNRVGRGLLPPSGGLVTSLCIT